MSKEVNPERPIKECCDFCKVSKKVKECNWTSSGNYLCFICFIYKEGKKK